MKSVYQLIFHHILARQKVSTMLNQAFAISIQRAAQDIIRSNPKLADTLVEDAKGMFKRGQIKVCLDVQRQVIGCLLLPWLFSAHGHDQAIFMSYHRLIGSRPLKTCRRLCLFVPDIGNMGMMAPGMMAPVCVPRWLYVV
jgi:hypothetical protein